MGLGLLAATTTRGGGGGILIVYLVLYLVFTLGVYGAYKKAGPYGAPAWAAFVPIYNFIVLLRIAGRPRWWAWALALSIVPFVGELGLLVVSVIVLHDVSKSFGHGGGFTVGLVLLSVIFWYILWLGSSRYRGPAGPAAAAGGFGSNGYGSGGFGSDGYGSGGYGPGGYGPGGYGQNQPYYPPPGSAAPPPPPPADPFRTPTPATPATPANPQWSPPPPPPPPPAAPPPPPPSAAAPPPPAPSS